MQLGLVLHWPQGLQTLNTCKGLATGPGRAALVVDPARNQHTSSISSCMICQEHAIAMRSIKSTGQRRWCASWCTTATLCTQGAAAFQRCMLVKTSTDRAARAHVLPYGRPVTCTWWNSCEMKVWPLKKYVCSPPHATVTYSNAWQHQHRRQHNAYFNASCV